MKKLSLIGASALALGVAIGPHAALANSTGRNVLVFIADYNAAQVKTAGDIVTVPEGWATYNNTSGTLEVNSRFTVTLPAGFSFSSQPALAFTGPTVFQLNSGGIGSQSTTFTVTGAPLLPGNSVSLLSFAVQGVTALETPIPAAAALPITMQSTNNSQILNNDAKPLSAPFFASEPGIAVGYVAHAALIDLSSPTLGTLFVGDTADTTTVPIVELAGEPQTSDAATRAILVFSPDGRLNTLTTTDTMTITIPGPFNGISGAFIANDPSCGSAVVTGTATPSLITIPGVPLGNVVYVCITSGGTTLLQEDLAGSTSAIS